ncbi:hypothetical protein JCM12298_29660 [Desulfothermus naphthae]
MFYLLIEKSKLKKTIIFLLFILFGSSSVFGMTPSEEKKLFQDISEIKATLKIFMEQTDKRFRELREDVNKRFELIDKRFEQMDKRFEDINRRFEDINKRFEDMNKRFEDVNKRFDEIINFLWILTAIFTTLTATVIGFVYWDRRTIIKKSRDEAIEALERQGKLRDLINALRELAEQEPELKTVLKQFNLL